MARHASDPTRLPVETMGPGGEPHTPPEAARPLDAHAVPGLEAFLQLPHPDVRAHVLRLLREEAFQVDLEIPRPDHRAQVLAALKRLADEGIGGLGFPAECGGGASPARSIAAFETLGFGDTSILVKYGVQFGLFGGSVYQLGTRRHHERWLGPIIRLELPGCYAMTEIGHGSNVRELETTATFDGETGEWVVHTPHPGAGKEWIGNAALHGHMATVFAQLVVGGEEHGVHALLVPLRDRRGRTLPGVRIEDNGPKVGLNGIDNGRIWFDRVRVPRENLLNRFGDVTPDGRYHSPIESAGRRFFTMLGTLVAGRISIAAASVSAAKTGLAIAVRYSDARRQFGPEDGPEVPILDYTVHQRLLIPRIARSYAFHFAVRELVERYDRLLVGPSPGAASRGTGGDAGGPSEADLPPEEMREVEARAAGLKALASWHCADTLQAAREAMGGRGYHAANRLGRLRADTDIFTTFEGANVVLLQLVAKSLLTHFREEMGDLKLMGMVRFLADRAGARLAELNPVLRRRTDPDHLRDPDFHAAALRYREERLTISAARRLKARLDDGVDAFEAFNECQDHLVTLGRAHTERIVLESFHRAVARGPTPGISETLRSLAQLHGLRTLEEDRAWFLEAGHMDGVKTEAVRAQVTALCAELRDSAVGLVDAWGIPDPVLAAPDVVG